MFDLDALRTRIAGPVLAPEDPGFAEEVSAWNLTFTNVPQVAIGVTSAADVAEAVKFAKANGLAVRVQGTGHGSEFAIGDGLLILTRRLDSISIDAATRLATIGAGVAWGAVVAAAAPLGLAPITGSAATVGVLGLVLGGGLGPLARSHGFASDRVRGFELVTADGDVISANADEHPDLFWALRGGKGGFGVVTQITVELVELETLYGGSLLYAADDIEVAYRAWVEYTATADPDVTTSAAIMRFPDFPFLPEPLRGRTLLSIRFAYPGHAAKGEQLAAPLRAAAPVYIDGLGEMPAADIAKIHNDPTEPSVGWIMGRMLTSIDAEFATALLAQVGAAEQAPFVSVEVRHLGSATARDVAGGSAVGGRTPEYALTIVGAPNPALFEAVIPQAAGRLIAQLEPWLADETNINFLGRCESPEQFATAWPTEMFDRLAKVRRQVDPEGMFAYGPR